MAEQAFKIPPWLFWLIISLFGALFVPGIIGIVDVTNKISKIIVTIDQIRMEQMKLNASMGKVVDGLNHHLQRKDIHEPRLNMLQFQVDRHRERLERLEGFDQP